MIRRGPHPERWTTLDNLTVRDRRLSWKARGLLAYLLSHREDWSISAERLVLEAPDGRHAVLSALSELETARYVQRVRTQDARGRWRTEVIVYDRPHEVDDAAATA